VLPVAGVAKAAGTPGRGGQPVNDDQCAVGHLLDDQLGNAVTPGDGVRRCGIGVDQQHLEFTPEARVNESGGVQARHPMVPGEAAAGLDEACPPLRQGDRHAGGHQRPSPAGSQVGVRAGPKVQPGVPLAGVRRGGESRIQQHHRHRENPGVERFRGCSAGTGGFVSRWHTRNPRPGAQVVAPAPAEAPVAGHRIAAQA